jgi:hypothetical protein
MMNTEKIIAELDAVSAKLAEQLGKFSDEDFNARPGLDGWSAGDVAEHLLMLHRNINRNLRLRTVDAGRPADEKVDIIMTVFGDYEKKYNAPLQIIPSDTAKNKTAMIEGLEAERKKLVEVIQRENLELICKGFNHPSLGAFTRLEWIYFIIHHAERHIYQLAGLHAVLG